MKYYLTVKAGHFWWWTRVVIRMGPFDSIEDALEEAGKWKLKRRWWRYRIDSDAGTFAGGGNF